MNQLQQFCARLLEASGAEVEAIAPEGLEVLSPTPVQQALALPEWARLGFGVELPDGAQRVTLESQMMERVSALLGEHGRHTRRTLAPSNPWLDSPQQILDQTLDLPNATYRLDGVAPAWTCYEILSFRYTAISDEKRDGILQFGFNRANGATLDGMLLELLAGANVPASPSLSPTPDTPPLPWERPQFTAMLERTLPLRLRHHLAVLFQRHVASAGTGSAAALLLSPGLAT